MQAPERCLSLQGQGVVLHLGLGLVGHNREACPLVGAAEKVFVASSFFFSMSFCFSVIGQVQGDAVTLGAAVQSVVNVFPHLLAAGFEVAPGEKRCAHE